MTEEEKKRIKEEEKLLNEQSDPSSAAAETPKVEEEPKADIEPAIVTAEAPVKPAAPAATAETAAEVVVTPAAAEATKEEVNEMYDTARARGAEQPEAVATPVPAEAPAAPAAPAQPVAAPSATTPATPTTPTTTPSISQQIKATADKVAPVGQLNPNLLPDKDKTIDTINDLNDRSEDAKILGTMAKGQREVVNAYDDLMKATANINAKQEAELRDIEAGNNRAARWASIGEAVAAFGNSIAVAGGASHQQYKPVSQDWMRQADASRRERMKAVASMEQNLAQQKARIAEMKQRGSDALIETKMKLQDRRLKNKLTELQMKREEAYTKYYEAQSTKAAAAAKGEADLYDAKIREIESRIEKNKTTAEATTTRANAYAGGVQNKSQNDNTRTKSKEQVDAATIEKLQAQVKELESRVEKNNAVTSWYNNNKGRGTVTPGTGPVKPKDDNGNGKPDESKKKEETPSLDKIFG